MIYGQNVSYGHIKIKTIIKKEINVSAYQVTQLLSQHKNSSIKSERNYGVRLAEREWAF